VTDLLPRVLFKSMVLTISRFRTSEISTLKLHLPQMLLSEAHDLLTRVSRNQRLRSLQVFGLRKLNFQPSFSLEVRGFLYPAESNSETHFRVFTRIPWISALYPPESRRFRFTSGLYPESTDFFHVPSGSDGPDSLRTSGFEESQFSTEAQMILSKVRDLSPRVPLDLTVQIHSRLRVSEVSILN
jgi:hypothetical protein